MIHGGGRHKHTHVMAYMAMLAYVPQYTVVWCRMHPDTSHVCVSATIYALLFAKKDSSLPRSSSCGAFRETLRQVLFAILLTKRTVGNIPNLAFQRVEQMPKC